MKDIKITRKNTVLISPLGAGISPVINLVILNKPKFEIDFSKQRVPFPLDTGKTSSYVWKGKVWGDCALTTKN